MVDNLDLWNSLYKKRGARRQSPFTQAMHDRIRGIIPAGVESILDAGCGGGALMVFLSREGKYKLHGLDLSEAGVQHVKDSLGMSAEVGNVLNMENIADNSYDLVVCSEVIEHLKQAEVMACVQELVRVAKTAVIITCPYAETLSYHHVVCGQCQSRFHVVGHINVVDENFLSRYFDELKCSFEFFYSGKREWRSKAYSDHMRSRGLNIIEIPNARCPICDQLLDYPEWDLFAKAQRLTYKVVQNVLFRSGVWSHGNIIALVRTP